MLSWKQRVSADIWLLDSRGVAYAAVDVLASSRVDRAFAVNEYMRAMRTPASWPSLKFFVLVTTRNVWIWTFNGKQAESKAKHEPAEIPLPGYMKDRLPRASLDEYSLRLLTFEWLIKVREFGIDQRDPAERELNRLGFVRELTDASIEFGDAA